MSDTPRPRDDGSAAAHHRHEIRHRYHEQATHYDRRWARYLEGTLAPTLDALLADPGDRALDVGCGTGLLLARLAERRPDLESYGVDISPDMLGIASARRPSIARFVAGDAHHLPFATASIDVAISTSSLHHWRDPSSALAEIGRIVPPGGLLILTDWNDDDLVLRVFSRILRVFDSSHRRSYRFAELERLLDDAGFTVESLRRYRVGWRWGMMTVAARRQ